MEAVPPEDGFPLKRFCWPVLFNLRARINQHARIATIQGGAVMLIAQISDLHITADGKFAAGKVDTRAALAAAVDELNALRPRPDLVAITGDLINGPLPGEYEVLAEVLARLELPWCAIPG